MNSLHTAWPQLIIEDPRRGALAGHQRWALFGAEREADEAVSSGLQVCGVSTDPPVGSEFLLKWFCPRLPLRLNGLAGSVSPLNRSQQHAPLGTRLWLMDSSW